MMNKLTGTLRNTQPNEQPQALQQACSRSSTHAGPPMPGTPQPHLGPARQSPPATRPCAELDHAPSMALMPSSKSLAVPASFTDEALPRLQPLPGLHACLLYPQHVSNSTRSTQPVVFDAGWAVLAGSAIDHVLQAIRVCRAHGKHCLLGCSAW